MGLDADALTIFPDPAKKDSVRSDPDINLYLCRHLLWSSRVAAHISFSNCGAGLFRASVARDGCHLFPTAD